MRRILALFGALTAVSAVAQKEITVGNIDMAVKINGEVKLDKSKEFTKAFNIYTIENSNPLDVEVEALKDPLPGNKTLINICFRSVKKILKAPATAKFPLVREPKFFVNGGIYYVSGQVDAQNGYGALIRSNFSCIMAQSKVGLMYVLPDVYSR